MLLHLQGALSPAEIASLVTPLEPPANFTGTCGDAQIILNWTAASNAKRYNLKRSLADGGPYTIIATNVPALAFSDTGLLNGPNYFYVVKATDIASESSHSIQVELRPSPRQPRNCVLPSIRVNCSSVGRTIAPDGSFKCKPTRSRTGWERIG